MKKSLCFTLTLVAALGATQGVFAGKYVSLLTLNESFLNRKFGSPVNPVAKREFSVYWQNGYYEASAKVTTASMNPADTGHQRTEQAVNGLNALIDDLFAGKCTVSKPYGVRQVQGNTVFSLSRIMCAKPLALTEFNLAKVGVGSADYTYMEKDDTPRAGLQCKVSQGCDVRQKWAPASCRTTEFNARLTRYWNGENCVD